MKRFLNTIGALGFVVAFPILACACMCGVSDAEGAFLGAKVVFVGKVTKIVRTKEASVGLLMKESGTLKLFKAAGDKFNERLPPLATGICARTERMRWAKDDVEVIRRILKGETIPNDQRKPIRIIY